MKRLVPVIAAAALSVAGAASAALDSTALTTVTSGIQADAQTAFEAVLPVLGVVLGLVVGIKLFKRFVNKI